MAVCFAKHGYKVVGIDTDQHLLAKLREGQPPFHEPNLQGYLADGLKNKNFTVTDDPSMNSMSDIAFITVGTPSQANGQIDLSYVVSASKMIGHSLRSARHYQLVVVKSTVAPGTARNVVKPVIDRESNKAYNLDYSVCSNPEFLREGRAIYDSENPDRIIIGSDDHAAIERLEKFYQTLYSNTMPTVIRTTFENAELTKYANNAFLATKVSFINCIASIAERIPHTDVNSIASAIGLDARIGPHFLNAGLGWGGSCLPKDLHSLLNLSENLGYRAELIAATDETNRQQAEKAVEFAKQALGALADKRVAILGLAFKPETDDMREAVSVRVINRMLGEGASVSVSDPLAMENAKRIFGDRITYAANVDECIEGADCCILVTEWPEFKKLNGEAFVRKMRTPTVVDGRRLYDPKEFKKAGVKLFAVGVGPEGSESENR